MTKEKHLSNLSKRFSKIAEIAANNGKNISKITRKISLIGDLENISEGLIPYLKVQLNTKKLSPLFLKSVINASRKDGLFIDKEDKANNIEIRKHI